MLISGEVSLELGKSDYMPSLHCMRVHSVIWYAVQAAFCGVLLVPELGNLSTSTSNSTKEYYEEQLNRNVASEVNCVR